jgi:hypothetical protein
MSPLRHDTASAAALLESLRRGDPTALAALDARHGEAMRRLAWGLVGDARRGAALADEARHLAAEALRTSRHAPEPERLRAWLLDFVTRRVMLTRSPGREVQLQLPLPLAA